MFRSMLSDHALQISYFKREKMLNYSLNRPSEESGAGIPYPRMGLVIDALFHESLSVTFCIADYFFLEKFPLKFFNVFLH